MSSTNSTSYRVSFYPSDDRLLEEMANSTERALNGWAQLKIPPRTANTEGCVEVLLVDAHHDGFFEQLFLLDKEKKEIVAKTIANKTLLLVSSEPSLEHWVVDERIRRQALYIRALLAHGVAYFVPIPQLVPWIKRIAVRSQILRRVNEEFVAQLREDITSLHKLFVQVLAEELDVKAEELAVRLERILGEDQGLGTFVMAPTPPTNDFCHLLAAVHSVGRFSSGEIDLQSTAGWLKDSSSHHKLQRSLATAIHEDFNEAETSPKEEHSNRTLVAALRLRIIDLLGDLTECFASAAAAHIHSRATPLRVALIDDNPAQVESALKLIQESPGYSGSVTFRKARVAFWDRLMGTPTLQGSSDLLGTLETDAINGEADAAEPGAEDAPFDVFLVDVDFRGRVLGPTIVRRLAEDLDRQQATAKAGWIRPGIVVLSLSQDTEVIHECYRVGADAYIPKQRIFALPAELGSLVVRGPRQDPRGQKSNFRSLYQLPPRVVASLQERDPESVIAGQPLDDLERAWIRAIPKTDLHHHIGTCIGLRAIEAMAANTVGYLGHEFCLRRSGCDPKRCATDSGQRVATLLQDAWRIAVNAAGPSDAKEEPTVSLLRAAELVLDDGETSVASGFAKYGDIGRALARRHRVEEFEAMSALVLSVVAFRAQGEGSNWDDIAKALAARWEIVSAVLRDAQIECLTKLFLTRVRGIVTDGWNREMTRELAQQGLISKDAQTRPVEPDAWRTAIESRVVCAINMLKQAEEDVASSRPLEARALVPGEENKTAPSLIRPPKNERPQPHGLGAFIRVPDDGSRGGGSLQRYLLGADLVGADHLQYPENLLLAASDLVDQAVTQNILYSEIRCATLGYTAGGMSAVDATDLLCIAFDLAAAHAAAGDAGRWVRTNLLLGAKRHKPDADFKDTIALLTYYLQRGANLDSERRAIMGSMPPEWWRPCSVIGFDLSGNEAVEAEKFRDMVDPLFKSCASITVHAGEAASAESIWQAVYRLGARRIGHGLRLRENKRLLDFCVTEGICMELCPISNRFTNGYVDAPLLRPFDFDHKSRTFFPLRDYLDHGLDCAICTDNREINGLTTIIDDYQAAARMSGGLTKWEVFKLAKAGFKHAFLAKRDIETMLASAEKRAYLVAAAG